MPESAFDASKEDRALNQYWYSPATIRTLVDEIERRGTCCAFLSTPSLYFALKSEVAARAKLLEFDKQWASDPNFVFYDFQKPTQVPVSLMDSFDYIVVDPPFITREVWSQYMETVKLLLKAGGAVLFTSVLENHGMLEELLDQSLFVAQFRPSIPRLTYQYHCFTNYVAQHLAFENPELEPEDPKVLAGLRMANDLRESEKAFTAQMHARSREGETLLPTAAHAAEQQLLHSGGPTALGSSERVLKWTHIPEGLTMYANGAESPPEEPVTPVDYGPVFQSLERRRGDYERFKKGVDQSQRYLDVLLKNRNNEAVTKETEALREKLLDDMREIIASIQNDPLHTVADDAVLPALRECVAAYSSVSIEKGALQELAADATRKYKSPAFNRQRELLQEMKIEKKRVSDVQVAPKSIS